MPTLKLYFLKAFLFTSLFICCSSNSVQAQRIWDVEYLEEKMGLEGLVGPESKAALALVPAKLDRLELKYQLDSTNYAWLCLQVFRVLAQTHTVSYQAANQTARVSLESPAARNNRFATRALLNLEAHSRFFSNEGMGKRGIIVVLRTLDLARQAEDLQTGFDLCLLMANIYIRNGGRDLAKEWIAKARDILPHINDPLNCHLYHVQAGDLLNPVMVDDASHIIWPSPEARDQAVATIDKSIECGLEAFQQGHLLSSDLMLAYHIRSAYFQKQKGETKLYFYRKSYQYSQYRNSIIQGEAYAELAGTFMDENIMDSALLYLDSAMVLPREYPFDYINSRRVYSYYSNYYELLGNQPDSVNKYTLLSSIARANETGGKAVSEMELSRIRYQESQNKVAYLKQARELDSKRTRNQILIGLLIAVSFIFALVIVAFYRIRKQNGIIRSKNIRIESILQTLKDSLQEKNLLYQEVQHRVKNNLQMITAFVDIQSANISQDETRSFAESIRKRIHAVNLIHELIVGEKGVDKLTFARYLEELVGELEALHYSGSPMECHLSIPEIQLDRQIKIQFGIILNEMVSNSMKYAVTAGEKLTIWMQLDVEEDGFVFRYRDSGTGVPPGVMEQPGSTIGIRLIKGVARQLGGELTYERHSGGEYVFHFPDNLISRQQG